LSWLIGTAAPEASRTGVAVKLFPPQARPLSAGDSLAAAGPRRRPSRRRRLRWPQVLGSFLPGGQGGAGTGVPQVRRPRVERQRSGRAAARAAGMGGAHEVAAAVREHRRDPPVAGWNQADVIGLRYVCAS
jgi:hypothetical protein